jgi:excisionase family DNA binding protein
MSIITAFGLPGGCMARVKRDVGGQPPPDGLTPSDRLMLPAEVAALFGVEGATVSRWVREQRLPAVRTLGGHHRFRSSDIERLLSEFGSRRRPRAD